MNPNDHDILIVIAENQREMKVDMKSMADSLRELKSALDQTNQRQYDLENRMTNISGTVQRSLAEQNDDHRLLTSLRDDLTRWKLYIKVIGVLLSPVYVAALALLIEYGKHILFP